MKQRDHGTGKLRATSGKRMGMPFEVLSIISLKLKEANPEAVLISVTGGYNGYLSLAEDFARQGYECSFGFTHFAPGTGDTALKTAIEESLLI